MDCSDVGFLSVFRFFIAHVVAARKIDEVKCEKMICGLRVLGQEIVGSWKYYWVYSCSNIFFSCFELFIYEFLSRTREYSLSR